MKLLLATFLALTPTTALADYGYYNNSQPGWSSSQRCIKKVYREEYIPGTETNTGYVRTYYDEVKIRCNDTSYYSPSPAPQEPPNRNCVRGSILGAILGGGVAAGLSKPNAMVWSIPVGVVTGAIAGCEVQNGGN